jgi:ATP-dependent 26S proteasome regulatory subunit
MTVSSTTFLLVRLLREELQLLQEPGSYVGEVVKVMGKKKVLVKVQPEGKYGSFLQHHLRVDRMILGAQVHAQFILLQSSTFRAISPSLLSNPTFE